MHAVNRVVEVVLRQLAAKYDADDAANESRYGQRRVNPYPSRSKLLDWAQRDSDDISYVFGLQHRDVRRYVRR